MPFWRSPDDINITEDIYEEVARIYGYERIQALPLLSTIANTPYVPMVSLIRKLEECVVQDFHMDQTETYPWISSKIAQEFAVNPSDLYEFQNPVNPEMPYLRDDMLY